MYKLKQIRQLWENDELVSDQDLKERIAVQALGIQEEEQKSGVGIVKEHSRQGVQTECIRMQVFGIDQNQIKISEKGLHLIGGNTEENKVSIGIGNQIYSEGLHYLEIICPKYSKNIEIGIIKLNSGIQELTKPVKIKLVSNTEKKIGLKIDLIQKLIRIWVNGNEDQSSQLDIPDLGPWRPYVQIDEADLEVIVNPYATDPEAPFSNLHSNVSFILKQNEKQIFKELRKWCFLKNDKNSQNNFYQKFIENFNFIQRNFISRDQNIICLYFEDIQEVNNFQNQYKYTTFQDQWILSFYNSEILEAATTFLLNNQWNLEKLLKDEAFYLNEDEITLVNVIINEKNQILFNESLVTLEQNIIKKLQSLREIVILNGKETNSYQQQYSNNVYIQELHNKNGVIVKSGNFLKIIKNTSNNTNNFSNVFNNKVTSRNDQYTLRLQNGNEVQILLKAFNIILWENVLKCYRNSNTLKSLEEILPLLLNTNQMNHHITITATWWSLHVVIDIVTEILTQGLQDLTKQQQQQEGKYQSFMRIIKSDQTIEDIYQCLEVILRLQEQLYTGTMHSECRDQKIIELLYKRTTQVNRGWIRFISLIDIPQINKPQEMAELGIYNILDDQVELRLYQNPRENITNILQSSNQKQFLNSHCPKNRLLKGVPCGNIPLAYTINNLTHVIHDGLIDIQQTESSNFIVSISRNGTIKLWNTFLQLFECGSSDFRNDLEISSEQFSGREFIKFIQKNYPGDFEILKQDEEAKEILRKFIQEFESEEKIQKNIPIFFIEPEVVVDTNLLNELYNMGFPIDVSKKALIQTKNNITTAIDTVLQLLDEEQDNSENSQQNSKEPEEFLEIKLQWICPICTYVSLNGARICVMCQTAAPPEAYITVKRENSKDQKQQNQEIEEQQKQKEAEEAAIQKEKRLNFLRNSQIQGAFICNIEDSVTAPLVVGIILQENSEVELKVRRFGFALDYLQEQLNFHQKNAPKDNISRDFIKMFNENKNQIETYGPLFNGVNTFESLKKYNLLEAVDEINLCVPLSSVELIISLRNSVILIIGRDYGNQQQFKCLLYCINNVLNGEYHLPMAKNTEIELISENYLETKYTYKKLRYLSICDNYVYIYAEEEKQLLRLFVDNKELEVMDMKPIKSVNVKKQNLLEIEYEEEKSIKEIYALNTQIGEEIEREYKELTQEDIEQQLNEEEIELLTYDLSNISNLIDQFYNSANFQTHFTNEQELILDNTQSKEMPHSLHVNILVNGSQLIQQNTQDICVPLETVDDTILQEFKLVGKVLFGDTRTVYVPLNVEVYEGAAYNVNYQSSSLLFDDEQIFCSHNQQTSLLFTPKVGDIILAKEFQIKSDILGTRTGIPLQKATVYCGNNLDEIYEEYNKMYTFEFQEDQDIIKINFQQKPVLCRYIVLKFHELRKNIQKTFSYHVSGIELKFFGILGQALNENCLSGKILKKFNQSENSFKLNINNNNTTNTTTTLQILKFNSSINLWQEHYSNQNPLQIFKLFNTTKNKLENINSINGHVFNFEFRVPVDPLFKKYKIHVSNTTGYIGLLCNSVSYYENFLYIGNNVYSKYMLNQNILKESQLLEKLLKMGQQPQNIAQPELLFTILRKILQINPELTQFYIEQLNLDTFIKNGVFKSNGLRLETSLLLLWEIILNKIQNEEFMQNLQRLMKQLFRDLLVLEINSQSLQRFFSLFMNVFKSLSQDTIQELVGELRQISQEIANHRSEMYSKLLQRGIKNLVLEEILFSPYDNQILKQSIVANCRITATKISNSELNYQVELSQPSTTSQIGLYLNSKYYSHVLCNTYIEIYFSQSPEQVLYKKYITKGEWHRISQYSKQANKYFRGNEDNYIKIPFHQQNIQAFKIKIVLDQGSSNIESKNETPNDLIVCEVYLESIIYSRSSIKKTKTKNYTSKDVYCLPNGNCYEVLEEEVDPSQTVYRSFGYMGEIAQIPMLQIRELINLLKEELSLSNMNSTTQKEQIEILTKQIEIQQMKNLVGINFTKKPLDFYYILATNIIKLLQEVNFSNINNLISPEDLVEIGLDLFDTFISKEEVQPYNETIEVLNSYIIPSLNDDFWQLFIDKIFFKYLINYEKDLRHIIKTLEKFRIPSSELIRYLANYVNETPNQWTAQDITLAGSIFMLISLTLHEQPDNFQGTRKFKVNKSNRFSFEQTIENQEDLANIQRSRTTPLNYKNQQSNFYIYDIINLIGLEKIDLLNALKLSLYINIFISEQSTIIEKDRAQLLTIGFNVTSQLLRLVDYDNLKQILQNTKSFLKLLMAILKLESNDLLMSYRNILEHLIDPYNIDQNENENETLVETREQFILIIQDILQKYLDYALNLDNFDTQIQDIGQITILQGEIKSDLWLKHVQFLLEFLIFVSDKYSENKKKTTQKKLKSQSVFLATKRNSSIKDVRIPLILSTSSKGNNNSKYPRKASKSLQIDLALSLVQLSQPTQKLRAGYVLSNSIKLWSLIMKSTEKVKIRQLIEKSLYRELANSFLATSLELREVLYHELLVVTQSIVVNSHNQKEICKIIIEVVFDILENVSHDCLPDPVTYNLLKSLLDILLTGNITKHEENIQKAFCKFNPQGTSHLLAQISKYLYSQVNLGSTAGTLCAPEYVVLKLQIANELFMLLLAAESTADLLAVTELFSNAKKHQEEIKMALGLLIKWFLLNYTEDTMNSPSTTLLKQVLASVSKFFSMISNYQEVCKQAIECLLQETLQIQESLLELSKAQNCDEFTIKKYMTRCSKATEDLFKKWLCSEEVSDYILLVAQGFTQLLQRISSVQHTKEEQSHVSILNNTNLMQLINETMTNSDGLKSKTQFKNENQGESLEELYKPATVLQPQKPPTTSNSFILLSKTQKNEADTENKEEELAAKITLLNQPGQTWSNITQDWAANKRGARARVLFFNMTGKNYNEYSLLFKLEEESDLNIIKIGFITSWTDYTDTILGVPSSVLLEGGTSLYDLTPLAVLQPLNDEGYTNYAVKVFYKNFNTHPVCETTTPVHHILKSLAPKRVKYIRLKFKRPIVTFIEGNSMISTKNYRNVAVAISFLSMNGAKIKYYDKKVLENVVKLQISTSISMLSRLCTSSNQQSLFNLVKNPKFIKSWKENFDILSNLLEQNVELITPIILAISNNNNDIAFWILNKFIIQAQSQAHAKILREIVLTSKHNLYQYIQLFNQFITTEISKHKIGAEDSLNKLIPYIEMLITTIRLSNLQLQQQYQQETTNDNIIHLHITTNDIDNLIYCLQNKLNNKMFIKLLIFYTNLPLPFRCADTNINLLQYTLQYLISLQLENSKENIFIYEILGPIAIGSEEGRHHIRQTNVVKKLIQDFFELAQTSSNQTDLRRILQTMLCLPYDKQITIDYIQQDIQLIIDIYNTLQVTEEKVLKDFGDDIYKSIINLLTNFSIDNPNAQRALANCLIQDLNYLQTDYCTQFVNKILQPMLNSDYKIPLFIVPFDSRQNQWLAEGRRVSISNEQPIPLQVNPIKGTKILNQLQNEVFLENLKKITSSSGLFKKIIQKEWSCVIKAQEEGMNLLEDLRKMQRQGPFLILLKGRNNEKECTVGIFCSQQIPELPEAIDSIDDQEYPIPLGDDCFFFYYQDDQYLHFPLPDNPQQVFFGVLHTFFDNGGGLSFFYNNVEKVFISLTYNQTTFIDLNLEEMKPLEQITNLHEIGTDFQFVSAEYWLAQQIPLPTFNKQDSFFSTQYQLRFHEQDWYFTYSPLNYYRDSEVFQVPAALTVEQFALKAFNQSNSEIQLAITNTQNILESNQTLQDIYQINQKSNSILDVTLDITKFQQVVKSQVNQMKTLPDIPVFKYFLEFGGFQQLFRLATDSLVNWETQESIQNWQIWLNELAIFAKLPNFLILMIGHKECMDLLFGVVAGGPDNIGSITPEKKENEKQQTKNWIEQELHSFNYIYELLYATIKQLTNEQLQIIVNEGIIHVVMERLHNLSKEIRRSFIQQDNKNNNLTLNNNLQKQQTIDNLETSQQKLISPQKVKKGVGYASDNNGRNEKWDVNEYIENRKIRSEQLKKLIDILGLVFSREWTPTNSLFQIIAESSLLPLLESAFRGGSLLDMSKEGDLYQSYLHLIKNIVKHQILIPLVLPLDKRYQPPQSESILQLLTSIKDLADIFLKCLPKNTEENDVAKRLAEELISTYNSVEAAVEDFNFEDQTQDDTLINDVLALPLAQAYRILLKDLRFDYTNMKQQGGEDQYGHHFSFSIKSSTSPPSTKMVRLAQELADLSISLPYDHTNGIFVRVEQTRVDVMKALIVGASDTPYAHGVFIYDIFFDDQYPEGPPKVNLETTGGGLVRFNPNLYACGKVCLSLLGTWRGNASENWDPKLSTLLQVLVSIQAVVMGEDVYFNEPGFETEAGTPDGEQRNEGYSNIVRYSNIKYAMIEAIRNPPVGFENVIKRHFYLKKNEILIECQKWLEDAKNKKASYSGLVADHNYNWCNEFKKSPTQYYDMLKDVIKELEIELNQIPAPSSKDILHKTKKLKKKKVINKTDTITKNELLKQIEQVDIEYEDIKEQTSKEISINDAGVMDRWSRYIGAMGIEAVAKQANASVFLSGVGPLGIEIAKNIVLSGVKRFTLHDNKLCSLRDIGGGQFFLNENDINKNRASQSLQKLRQLNQYVRVDLSEINEMELPETEKQLEEIGLQNYNVIILTENTYKQQQKISQFCYKNNIKFISCDIFGVFSRIYCDFGDKFLVLDKNGEDIPDVFIKNITNEENGLVTLLDGIKHKFEDGDLIQINSVQGMYSISLQENNETEIISNKTEIQSINETTHTIKIVNASSFRIGNTTQFTSYQGNGIAKFIRTPLQVNFERFHDALNAKNPPFDDNMFIADFIKIENNLMSHIAFQTLDKFIELNKRYPKSWDISDAKQFIELGLEIKTEEVNKEILMKFLLRFTCTCNNIFSPLAAFMGGYAAQECIKALTNKFMPTRGFFYIDAIEVVPQVETLDDLVKDEYKLEQQQLGNRDDNIRYIVGDKLYNKLRDCKLFLVGAGAIGCELLKNFAMLGLGTGVNGEITVTDPDVIEVSNLNRQFLFREKHLRKPKSLTAAAAVTQMNPQLKGKIIARLDKVQPATEYIYTDKFFEQLTIVTNALDNVQARRYIDSRCVATKIPLLESGTLGPKGHVQVILPYKTESYGSQKDPIEENDIPICTLKMFPEETIHCVEWARDKFSKIFSQKPKALLKLVEEFLTSKQKMNFGSAHEQSALREAIKMLRKRPKTFEDCIIWARNKYQKYFVNDIRQLMYTYPLDTKTKEGALFWSMPKRPPHELQLDSEDELDQYFITAAACLRARVFGIEIPENARSQQIRQNLAKQSESVKVQEFKASEEKAKEISNQVIKEQQKVQMQEGEEDEVAMEVSVIEQQKQEFVNLLQESSKNEKGNLEQICYPEEFEKDNDENMHIDYIYSMANLRAKTYKLEYMDWINVKLKAGRIIPALATTTSCIAGLQTIELCKVLINAPIEQYKNAFLSLAIPILTLSEPGPPPTTKISNELTTTIWDRWDIHTPEPSKANILVTFEILQSKYKLKPRDVFYKSTPVYLENLMNLHGREQEKIDNLNKPLLDLLAIDATEDYIDLTITFENPNKQDEILPETPTVRIYLK